MSNPYQSYQPQSKFSDSQNTSMPLRPAAGTVFGVLNLVFGIFGFCGLFMSAAVLFVPMDPQLMKNNVPLQLMQDNAVYRLFTQASIVLGFISLVVLIIAGIGLLQQRPYGRNLSIGYALYALGMILVGTVVNVLFVFPPLIEQLNANDPAAVGGAVGGLIGGTVGSCVGLVYPVLILYFMYRPNMVAAYSIK